MEEFLGKKYILVKSENDDEYLKFLGVSYIKRKIAQTLNPMTCLIKNDDGTYTLEMTFPMASSKNVFTEGVEFDETKVDDTKVRSIITFEGNKMTQIQNENGKVSTHVREYFPDKILVTTTAEGFNLVVKRVYELVK